MYPKRFEQLVAAFEKLPGVGGKTAQRYAFTMLEKDSEQIDEMVEALKGMRQIKRCRICGFLSDEDECIFCKDKTRSPSTLMVVAYPQDVAAIEKTGSYKTAMEDSFREIGASMFLTTLILCAMFGVYILSPMHILVVIGVLTVVGLSSALLADYTITPALLYAVKPFGKERGE